MARLGSLLTSTSVRDFLPQGGKNEEIMIAVFPQVFQRDLTEKKKIKTLNTAAQTVQIIF